MKAGEPDLGQMPRRIDPELAELTRWCLGRRFPIDRTRQRAVPKLVRQVIRRRRLSVLAHVHLVAAFRGALARGPIDSVLAVGCGVGVTELLLAATHPETTFTLADHDPSRLDTARETAAQLAIDNVRFEMLDLLDRPGSRRYDFVTTIEVLEHIEDDQRAADHLMACSSGWIYTLVPFCSHRQLTSERLCKRVWEQNGHYRPGYTRDTLMELFPQAAPEWVRACYYADRPRLHEQARLLDDVALDEEAEVFMSQAIADIRDDPALKRAEALGVELLCRVGGPPSAAPDL